MGSHRWSRAPAAGTSEEPRAAPAPGLYMQAGAGRPDLGGGPPSTKRGSPRLVRPVSTPRVQLPLPTLVIAYLDTAKAKNQQTFEQSFK